MAPPGSFSNDAPPEERVARLERRAHRERIARKEAERLLEEKSRALWDAHQALSLARDELEERVTQRTAELAAALRAAEQASEAKSTFLAHMSHELRTPLMAILGYTDDLRQQRGEQADLDVVHRNAEHLLGLINEVLDLAKVESRTLEVQTTPTDLHELVAQAVATCRVEAEGKGLVLAHAIGAGVPVDVEIDAMRVQQVLLNVLANAVKFTDEGGVVVDVTVSGPSRVRISVVDSGPGIPPDLADRLFEPFVRTHDRSRPGTGLGLAITAQLVRLLGGTIRVDSPPGQGSRFDIELPVRPVAPSAPEPPGALALEGTPLAGLRVLLADDARDSLALLERWVRRAGAETTAVEDGQQAVDALSSTYDIVLMDVQMPVLDGLAATRQLRARGDRTPILALTANTMAEDQLQCLGAGCDGFLAKPVDRERLLHAILEHVR